jgi:hypothetical protein
MINLGSMEWDHFNIIKKKVIRELINEFEGLEIPPDWRPREVLGLVLRKLEDKEKSC